MDNNEKYMKLLKKDLVKKIISLEEKEKRNEIFNNQREKKISNLENEVKQLRPLKKNVATQKAYNDLKKQKDLEINTLKAKHAVNVKQKDVLISKLTKTIQDLVNISRDGLDSVRINTNFVNNLLKNTVAEMNAYLPKPESGNVPKK